MRATARELRNAPRGELDPSVLTCERFAATQALKRLRGMWTTPVLLLLFDGPRRFSELGRELAPISDKVLAQRLQELERASFVSRLELVSEPPKTVEYRLTPLGEGLRPVFEALVVWERAAGTAARNGHRGRAGSGGGVG